MIKYDLRHIEVEAKTEKNKYFYYLRVMYIKPLIRVGTLFNHFVYFTTFF